MLRIAIIIIAALEIYWFSDTFSLSIEVLTPPSEGPWFNRAFALLMGVIAPLCAIAAGGLALAGKRLGLAGILLCVAPVLYMVPSIAFGIAVAIYGF
jgi:hypothetical protein